jgi:3-oxoacyl-(acyl-carrier-protein) synthase
MNEFRRVVITGMGVIAPNGNTLIKFSESIQAGKSGIKHIEELKEKKFNCQIGGIPQLENETVSAKYFSPGTLGKYSSAILYGCIAAEEAWLDAGLFVPDRSSQQINWESGIILGTGVGGIDVVGNTVVPLVNSGNVKRLGSTAVEQVMISGTSAYVAGFLALGNQVSTNSSACSTGTEAIVEAFGRIHQGYAQRILAGGCEGYSPYSWAGFDSMRVLNRTSNDQPEKGSRPLSATAAGFVPGAGSGILVLEELEFAKARGARIYAEILGGAINCGGQRNGGSITAPNPDGVRRCIHAAITQSQILPGDIDAISGHLTSTMADPLEVKNWAEALNRNGNDFPYINSVKSMIGHCLGAAGGVETVAAVLQLHEGFLHPSINCEDLHPEIERIIAIEKIPQKVKKMDLNIIAKASFGFGDVNSCLILKKWRN